MTNIFLCASKPPVLSSKPLSPSEYAPNGKGIAVSSVQLVFFAFGALDIVLAVVCVYVCRRDWRRWNVRQRAVMALLGFFVVLAAGMSLVEAYPV